MADHPLALARTFLFVPANRPERYARALAAGPGGVVIDLEDAVAPHAKASARAQIADAVATLSHGDRSRLLVRVNAVGTPWHSDDLALAAELSAQGVAGVVLPKAEQPDAVAAASAALARGAVVVPLVESAAGLDALDGVARSPGVLRLAFGHLDFQADLGMACAADETELVPVRLALVLATRRAGLPPPVDGVTVDWRDPARLQADASRSRRGGFGAKLCIHPDQVGPVHAALGPAPEELAWARRVLDALHASGGGVVALDGKMVDAPVMRLAQRLLAMET